MYMRSIVSRYETEIRLGLLVIVILLLFLNGSSTFVIYRVKSKLVEEVDSRLARSLNFTTLYLQKNSYPTMPALPEIPGDQLQLLTEKHHVDDIDIHYVSGRSQQLLTENLQNLLIDSLGFDRTEFSKTELLLSGKRYFSCGESDGHRLAYSFWSGSNNRGVLIVARTVSFPLEVVQKTSRTALYLGLIYILLLIPLTVFLPRLILQPFRQMRKTAQTAGRLPIISSGDEVAEVISSYENVIEELKQNEAELKRLYQESSNRADKLENLNRYILQSIGAGVINVDPSGKVIGYNQAAGNILGYAPEEVLNKRYQVAFPGEMELALIFEAGLQRGETFGRRGMELSRMDGSKIWLGLESSHIYDDTGRSVGITLLFNDLTEIKRLESELEINRRMAALGEMTGGLAHQLRNSLGAVTGFSQLLIKKTSDDQPAGKIAASILNEAMISERMIARFLNFARPLAINPERTDPVALIIQILKRFEVACREKNIELDFSYPEGPVSIVADEMLLSEALFNLIDNAIQAVDKAGQIKIKLENNRGALAIIIADNGPGIDPAIREDLFTPFVSSKPSGTGLGLALTRKIINLHEGTIEFDRDISKGAVCRIQLPLAQEVSSQLPISSHTIVK